MHGRTKCTKALQISNGVKILIAGEKVAQGFGGDSSIPIVAHKQRGECSEARDEKKEREDMGRVVRRSTSRIRRSM